MFKDMKMDASFRLPGFNENVFFFTSKIIILLEFSHALEFFLIYFMVYFSGRGIGSLMGGTLISIYSHRVVFCGIAVFSAVLAFLYLTIYHLGLRRRKKGSYPSEYLAKFFISFLISSNVKAVYVVLCCCLY